MGRTILVTGAGRGVGRACAIAFARAGDRVACAARTKSEIDETARACASAGAEKVIAIVLDATNPASVESAIGQVERELGAVEVLCHAAGGARTARFEKTDEALWRDMLETNLTSAFLVARAVLPGMRRLGRGRLVFVGSTASRTGYRYCAAYVAAKHGLLGMVRSLALEVADAAITANVVAPGFLDAESTHKAAREVAARTGRPVEEVLESYRATSPQRRLVPLDEVASAVAFLASEGASSVNGQCVVLDGGSVVA